MPLSEAPWPYGSARPGAATAAGWLGCSDPDDANTDDDSPGPFPVGCTAYGTGPDDLHVSLRGFLEPDGRGFVHLRTGRLTTEGKPLPQMPDGPAASFTDVGVAPDLTPETDDPPVRVVEGSALISDPLPAECVTGGYVAVLQVTGELLAVLRGYQRQFTSAGFFSEGLLGNDDEPRVAAETAGGGILTAVGVAGDPSHVLIERCND